ncbi:hypothetical protein NDU88_006830 [Pleurodeles waltl]|uniref:Uncharacterized protein n=1 Tax=Pleurodeles waltl TaxID=8319 RepID=A0AAV7SQM8_PLEWA|nr:hypothetical protein NDU88_006830 [Pleurodeles waltl]
MWPLLNICKYRKLNKAPEENKDLSNNLSGAVGPRRGLREQSAEDADTGREITAGLTEDGDPEEATTWAVVPALTADP